MTSTRRRSASLIVLGLTAALASCSDVVLPPESRPAAIAVLSGDKQSAPAGTPLGQPLVVRVTDALNRPVEGQAVAFTIQTGGGAVTPGSVKTDPDGQASADWTLGGSAGQQAVQAKVSGDGLPDTLLVKFSASALSGSGATLELVSGDNQTAPVNSALHDSLVVRVVDEHGNPVAGATVQWTTSGGGSISPQAVLTDNDGKAAAERVLGNVAGPQGAAASSVGLNSVSFTHTAAAANPTMLVLVSGDAQTGSAGAPLADSLVVRLQDANGNGVGGKPITWIVATGGGSVKPGTVNTSPNGLAKTQWTLGPGAVSNLLNAVFSGVPSVPFTATATAGAATKLAFTQAPVNTSAGATITPSVKVSIQDAAGNTVTSANNPVTVAIGVNPGGGALSGTATVSAVNGVATFSDLSIDKNGSGYTLTAAADGLTGATSPGFDIVPGNANRLVFIVGPTTRVVGQPFSPALQVQVQDAGGNPVQLATDPITLTSSVTGTLSGTAVATPVLGTATFSNLAINKAGTGYTLTAFESGVSSKTSDPFDVTQASTTISITGHTPGTSVPGQNVQISYDINIVAPGAGSLTGSVTVGDGTTSCIGSINAGSGTGSCTLALPTAGSHDLTATYSGDVNFVGSTSSVLTYTVNKANTTITISPEAPDPSVVGDPVTVQWNLTSPGSATLGGTVTLTVGGDPGTCSAPATLGVGSCPLTFLTTGSHPITATYSGDANYNGSTDNEPHSVNPINTAPTADDDGPYSVLEDANLNVSAGNGVLQGDTDPQNDPLTAVLVTGPSHAQSFTLKSDGSFTYAPTADYNGDDSFTYQASDGSLSSNTATVTITVTPVNDAPSFTVGSDQNVHAGDGPQTVPGWATNISAGPSDESGQTVSFDVSISGGDNSEFTDPPQVSGSGTLTYTPNPAASEASVVVTIRAVDTGGTADGGHDTSDPQTFTIHISP